MKKKIIFLTSFLSAAALLIVGFTASSSIQNKVLANNAGEIRPSSISFKPNENKIGTQKPNFGSFYDGVGTATTMLGNKIDFSYEGLANPNKETGKWQIIKSHGYFTNTQPIHGISNLTLNFSNADDSLTAYYSKDKITDLHGPKVTINNKNASTNFSYTYPNYVYVINQTSKNVGITSGKIDFTCSQTYRVKLTSNDLTKGHVSESFSANEGESVTITATPEPGYDFIGWYENDIKVSEESNFTFNMPNKHLNYQAYFGHAVKVTLLTDQKGTKLIGGGLYDQGSLVSINANSIYKFQAWKDDSYNNISTNAFFTFTAKHDVTLYATFSNQANSSFTLGSYPQTMVKDPSLINKLNAISPIDKWSPINTYLNQDNLDYMLYKDVELNNHKYRGIYLNQYRYINVTDTYFYQEKNGFNLHETYWFEYQPISWSSRDGIHIASQLVLDSQVFHHAREVRKINEETIYSNNYFHSDIRDWLNNNFFNLAFNKEEKELLNPVLVKNDLASTGYPTNPYLSQNSSDFVYLMSRDDFNKNRFSCGASATDYAKCMGVEYNQAESSSSFNDAAYFLRTPYNEDQNMVGMVNISNHIDSWYVDFYNHGTRPCISIL